MFFVLFCFHPVDFAQPLFSGSEPKNPTLPLGFFSFFLSIRWDSTKTFFFLFTQWIPQMQSHHFHTFPLILTSHSLAFHLILLDSHCIFTSVTALLSSLHLSNAGSSAEPSLPSCCLCCSSTVSYLTCCRAKPGTVHYLLQKKKKIYINK